MFTMSPVSVDATQNISEVEPDNRCGVNDDQEIGDEIALPVTEEVKEEKTRKGTVSIDVTKAILLLGFTSWSEIETG